MGSQVGLQVATKQISSIDRKRLCKPLGAAKLIRICLYVDQYDTWCISLLCIGASKGFCNGGGNFYVLP